MDSHQINGRNSIAPTSPYHFSFSVTRRLADKRSDSQSTTISENILPSSGTKSRLLCKSNEVRFDTNSWIHVYRHEISDTTKYSQGSSRSSRCSNSDYQNTCSSFPHSSFGTKFPFSFGQLSASADLVLLGRHQLRPLQMCLLYIWRPHILPLDRQITITSMIKFHLK